MSSFLLHSYVGELVAMAAKQEPICCTAQGKRNPWILFWNIFVLEYRELFTRRLTKGVGKFCSCKHNTACCTVCCTGVLAHRDVKAPGPTVQPSSFDVTQCQYLPCGTHNHTITNT